MSPSHLQVKSLSSKIFTTVLVFTLAVIATMGIVLTGIFFNAYESDAESDLGDRARILAVYLNESPSTSSDELALTSQNLGIERCTLVGSDGRVLFDSQADASTMENHAGRPEVAQALAEGTAATSRYSTTIGTDTLYAAVRLDDGNVVRLAETRHSLIAFLGNMIVPLLCAAIVAVALVALLSRLLTRRIMKPIDALDFSHPLDNEIYVEMDPLLIRIDEQQRRLRRQNDELAEAESLRRDFSSNVSHEMKTPLQVISGYAELMKNDMVAPEDRRRFAGLIYDEAISMRSLINDVLTLSKLDEAAIDPETTTLVDVHEVAERVAERQAPFAAEKGVNVVVKGSSALIAGNETLIEGMLYNLVENGIRYNHEGGDVTCEISREPASAQTDDGDAHRLFHPVSPKRPAEADDTAHEPTVVIRVSDTGMGIPPELHDKVFERFYRMEKSRSKETGGTGLGLAIVKHAVMYHDGTIEMQSAEGEGTTFVVRFADMTDVSPEDASTV